MKTNTLTNHLKDLYKDDQLFSSIILNSKKQNDIVAITDELIRFVYCENKSYQKDDCNMCKRALEHTLMDVVYIGDGATAVSKAEIQKMMDQLSLTAAEANGNKFYVIKNAENLKTEASNSLLKFLEEPPLNTYAVLLSNDRSKILQTIKSRCKLFVSETIHEDFEQNKFEKILSTKKSDIYLLAANNFKKMDKKELIEMIEESYSRTIIREYPQFAEHTLVFIEDLKYMFNTNVAIDNYFINIAEVL
ncbi:hypothetical protein [[Acholeplasma] multilocale]|uniref:hypothetical protein n=1 Tax=[Acholeplasma] multilocale TaxID=264638 RepID=UPI0003FE1ADB|nr:hypothetical protein [[Acholeplasma] multilocale]